MDLIVTHINADFDALASMVAAKKLYPDSKLLFPGSQERAVRDFMSLYKDIISVETEKECELRGIKRLIIVDTRLSSRIGKAEILIEKNGIETIVFDHHPRSKYDIKADDDFFDQVGATVTMLAELIRKKRIKLIPLEATIMLLGIYEETGSLTFPTTTKKDIDTVSFLLSEGANLAAVSEYLSPELTDKELALLVELIRATESFYVKGVKVAISSVTCKEYEEDLGVLANKLLDMENFNVVFILAKTNNKLHLVARSKLLSIDVNKITRALGGGGHPTAASAKITDSESDEVKNKILKLLKKNITTQFYAGDIMTYPVKMIEQEVSINDAREIALEFNLSGILVTDGKKIKGVITRQDLDKAIHRGFGHSKVKGYMTRNVKFISPKTPFYEIHRIMFEEMKGHLPVMKRGRLVGIVTRRELLRKLYGDLVCGSEDVTPGKSTDSVLNVREKMKSFLPEDILHMLKLVGKVADREGYSAFVVGGFVRDLILGVENFDLDIVIEGSAINFGRILGKEVSGTLVVHKKFGTATIVMPNKSKIDVATARREYYEQPAALPTVESSSIKDDLYRRDFTINAMAIRLNRSQFGELIDFFGGCDDLETKIVKVLHDLSFIDDPTRIFRAVRFEQRYDFKIEPHTEELIKRAVNLEMFDKTQRQRIKDEIILILKESKPLKGLRRMQELHELRFIHPKIMLTGSLIKLLQSTEEVLRWFKLSLTKRRMPNYWIVYFMALLDKLNYDDVREICDKFVFMRGDTKRILSYKKYSRIVLKSLNKKGDLKPSQIYKILEPFSYEVILLWLAKSKNLRIEKRLRAFLAKYSGTHIKISGKDLKRMGLSPSPRFKDILLQTLYAKIDGKLKSKADEIKFAARIIDVKKTKNFEIS